MEVAHVRTKFVQNLGMALIWSQKNVSPQFNDWNVCPIHKNNLDIGHCDYCSEHIQNLSTINVFLDLIMCVQNNPIPPLHVNIDMQMCQSDKNCLDFVALHYLPTDAPDSYAPHQSCW